MHRKGINAGRIARVILGQRVFREIPAGQFDGGFSAGGAAQRKNIRDIRHFAHRDAIDEIIPATIN